jgi:hypothetical protein
MQVPPGPALVPASTTAISFRATRGIMGASGWLYRTPFRTRIADALEVLQDQLLRSGDFAWDDDGGGPRPTTRQDLAAVKESEDFWTWGTHSVLDVGRAIPPEAEDHDGTVRPLRFREVEALTGTEYPSCEQFDDAYRRDPVMGCDFPLRTWSARCTVLYDGYRPTEYVFWGITGD